MYVTETQIKKVKRELNKIIAIGKENPGKATSVAG
jgi:hypothetical protein